MQVGERNQRAKPARPRVGIQPPWYAGGDAVLETGTAFVCETRLVCVAVTCLKPHLWMNSTKRKGVSYVFCVCSSVSFCLSFVAWAACDQCAPSLSCLGGPVGVHQRARYELAIQAAVAGLPSMCLAVVQDQLRLGREVSGSQTRTCPQKECAAHDPPRMNLDLQVFCRQLQQLLPAFAELLLQHLLCPCPCVCASFVLVAPPTQHARYYGHHGHGFSPCLCTDLFFPLSLLALCYYRSLCSHVPSSDLQQQNRHVGSQSLIVMAWIPLPLPLHA